MIKLFKKIRFDLLELNNMGKYLKYAFGEIVLVVLGILIALSINDWNESRKNRIAEKELYHTLIRSLESDLEDVIVKIVNIDSAILGQKLFIGKTFNQMASSYSDDEFYTLLMHVGNSSKSFVPNVSLYNKISQNKQIDLIRSEELQMEIIELYEVHYWEYKDLDAALERQAQSGLISRLFGDISHLFIHQTEALTIESFRNYYDELNRECRQIYFLTLSTRESMINCQRHIESLLIRINDELNK